MSKQAFKRVRKSLGLPVNRDALPEFAWPGGYPIFYVFRDGGCLCPACLNRNITDVDDANRGEPRFNSHGGWAVDAFDVNYEDGGHGCDHCGRPRPAAYSE
jgi:hypothetical protein